ncbi:LTP_2 domain-containing protein [Cephalotus follicularis]|uniref:LTP_2 domain-containing protein n=1 Tax=Cephalotus follicularis TaxID=3775 RepID=A0A1Q3DHH0_CEPFO|nr:LTP_2 domain-containing protein [Cephalotus follicularis]
MTSMKKLPTYTNIFLFTTLIFYLFVCEVISVSSEDCTADFQKVTPCLGYATGKATIPTKDCCTATKEIKESDPKCLCFIIQQTNNSSNTIKSMGIQVAKLLELPSACQLQNASASNCPKLLGISPSSPDAAIFTNGSTTATPSIIAGAGAGSSTSVKSDGTNGIKHGPYLVGSVFVIALAINFS